MDVLERFARGDFEAFEALFRQFQGEVYGWIVRVVRDRGIAEDLTVETFWRIYRAHARFHPEGNFGAWARRIATNAALDHLKTARREVALPEDLPARAQPDPAVHREVHEQIERAFRELPARPWHSLKRNLMSKLPKRWEFRLGRSSRVFSGLSAYCGGN